MIWAKPKNRLEFRKARLMAKESWHDNPALKMFQAIKGWKRSKEELVLFAYMGKFSPKLVNIFKITDSIGATKLIDINFPEINVNYLEVGAFLFGK